jgi:hypothetical protein
MRSMLRIERKLTDEQIADIVAVYLCILIVLLAMVLAGGCAVRHLANGTTQPATTFEQVLAWNAAIAQANDGFADNVIALQSSGVLTVAEAKTILTKQGQIAQADKRITDAVGAAAACGAQNAGSTATSAQLDSASAACAQTSGASIAKDVNLILTLASDLAGTDLVGVKDPAKRQALATFLSTVQQLINKIYASLESVGVVLKAQLREVAPWRLS